ncbi:MAG: tetratricopeptide repeat protein, partial [Bryobacteraceae bacterium]
RNVYKVAVAYAVVGWLVMQVAATIVPALRLPDSLTTAAVVVTLLGFPVALVIAWAFEMTPEGMKRTEDIAPNEKLPQWSRRKFAGFVIVVALLAVSFLGFRLWLLPAVSSDPSVSLKSVAVLPFESLSAEKDNSYFAAGVHDEILTRLAKIADLKVISRSSTEQYQSKPANLPEIARQLGVAHVLEGSVQKIGNTVRINVQLIKTSEDSDVWADTYDRKLTDIFAIETEVAERIAGSLAAQLTGGERQQIARIPTANPQAYDNYLRGLPFIRRQTMADIKQGRAFMQKAVDLDPLYAQAWAQISIAEAQLYFGEEHTPACLARAQRAAETAVRLQPELSEARSALGLFYYICLRDYDRALIELNEAHNLSPNDGTAVFYIGLVKRRQGRLDVAIEYLEKGTALDPRNQDIFANLARSYRARRDFAAARAAFDRAFAISPDEREFIGEKAETYMAEGDLDSAEKVFRGHDVQGTTGALGEMINLLVYRRRLHEAIQLFARESEKETGRSSFQKADDKSWLGSLHVMAGEKAEGRHLLEEARTELQAALE